MKQTYPYIIAGLLSAGLLVGCTPPDQSPTVQLSTSKPAQDARPLMLVATVASPASTPISKVEFFQGEAKLGEDTSSPYEQEVPINVNANTTLEFTAKATDQQNRTGKKSLSVSVTADTQAPTVSLNTNESSFTASGTLNLSATASDNIGVAKVEFYRGTTKLGEDDQAPYTLAVPITSANNGSNSFSAKAYDFKGLQGNSDTLSVQVDIDTVPPTISLSISSNNLDAVGSLILSAAASDNKGIARVEFFKDATKLGEDTSSPYTFEVAYNDDYSATDSFSARAIDIDGNSASSGIIAAAIDIDITPPSVSLSGSSTSFTTGGTLTLSATASDNFAVARVEFYRSEQKVGEDNEAPYALEVPITAALNGNNGFTAKAVDRKGLETTSEAWMVGVDIDATPPTVSLSASATSLTALGIITLSADAADNKGIARVEFYRGAEKLGEDTASPYIFDVVYSDSHIATDIFTAVAVDTDLNTAASNQVTATIDIDITPPTISLSPSLSAIGEPGTLTLTASATDNKGIAKVEFFKGSSKLGEDTTSPYTFDVAYNGSYNATDSFTARATDVSNLQTTSPAVEVVVDIDITPPTVSLSGSGTSFTTAGTLSLSATASDNRGIAKIEFYKSTTKLGEDTTSPYTLDVPITGADNGNHSFTAKAVDIKGNLTTSSAHAVTVDIDITPPTITLTRSPSSLSAPGNIVLSATASDNKGVQKVEFFKGSSKLGEDTASPYSFSVAYNAEYSGTDSFSARATDLSGNTTTSSAVTASIEIDFTLPTVSLTLSSTNLTGPSSLTLSATASDNRGVARVDFYRGTTLLLSDTTAPYSHTLSIVAADNGSVVFSAKAFDASNNMAQDDETVTVAITPTISSLSSTPTTLSADGGAFSLNWAAANQSGFNLSANPSAGVTGLPTSILAASVFSQNLNLAANTTRFDQTYTFTLSANGYGTASAATQTLSLTQTPAFSNLSAGWGGGCALIGGLAHCWGNALTLGSPRSSTAHSERPIAISQGAMPSGTSVTQISLGSHEGCALVSNGWAYCWGFNQDGAVGDGTVTARSTPTAVARGAIPTGVTLTRIVTDSRHTCAIGNNGSTYCWGFNSSGQLGSGNTTNRTTPGAVGQGAIPVGVTLSDIALGNSQTCALGSNGEIYCWGATVLAPAALGQGARPAGVSYTKIALGNNHGCGLGSNGRIYCWGNNDDYMLGDGTQTYRAAPVAVLSTNIPAGVTFTDVVAGDIHTCALGNDGKVYCWGTGFAASGSTSSTSIPIPTAIATGGIPAGVQVNQISSSYKHTCAIGSDKLAYCWGENDYRRLGRLTPNLADPLPGLVLRPIQ